MGFFAPMILPCVAAFLLYLRYRLRKARPSDAQAIDDLMKARGLRRIAVARDDDYGRYWSRGRLFSLSNCARIYVVVGEEPVGPQREIHVAFDDRFPGSGGLQILLEQDMPPRKSTDATTDRPP